MINLTNSIKKTTAFNIVKKDKENGSLSHAYLLTVNDKVFLKDYLKAFAKLICCEESGVCETCRTCTLIESEKHLDVTFLPKEKAILTADIDSLIENAYIKTFEGGKRLFILSHAENMNAVSQNKLLKILEEPPENVYILLGVVSDYPLLQTVKSRVKKLEIPPFSKEELFSLLEKDYLDKNRLELATVNSDFSVGEVIRLYENQELLEVKKLADSVIVNLNSSSKVLETSYEIMKKKAYFTDFINFLENNYRNMLLYFENKKELILDKNITYLVETSIDYKTQSIVAILDKISTAKKKLFYNGNEQMVLEWLLLQILEVKYICKKLSV
ncbi:MAG: hypothetical protein IKC71_03915 [Clostridia bacterium]|nr:hypothetical protein [Clostridia bacterium]